MHCYFDNLITIAKCFCKALRILQSNAQVWGAGPSSVFCSSVGVLCSPPPSTTQTIWSFTRTEKNVRTRSNSTLFWRQRLGCLSRLLALTIHQRSLFVDEGEIGEKRKEGKKKKANKKPHYCRPDGNIPHDQTNQSPRWGAGAAQPWSNTPFHSLSGTNTWSPINGTPRTWGGSLEPYWSMPDDFIITHHFIHWRIRTSILITFPGTRHVAHINRAPGELRLPSCCSPSRAGEEEATWSWELLPQTGISRSPAPLAEISGV